MAISKYFSAYLLFICNLYQKKQKKSNNSINFMGIIKIDDAVKAINADKP